MRLPRADRRIAFILITLFLALIFVQCIFVVGASAHAEPAPYEELIPDYYSFHTPTRVAAADGIIAVFDEGDVVIFRGDARTVIETGAERCDKLCVSEAGVCLLIIADVETPPEILSFTLEGERRDVAYPGEGVTDIVLVGDTLYTLSSVIKVTAYDLADATEKATFSLPNHPMYFSLAFSTDGEAYRFLSIFSAVFAKAEEGYDNGETVSVNKDCNHIFVVDDKVYYFDDAGNVRIVGESAPFLKKGAGDTAFSDATDLAVGGDVIAVLDGTQRAVKVYDLASGEFSRMIGSYGNDLKRLRDPVAISVKDGRIAVADASRISVFTDAGVYPLNGKAVSKPTDVVIAGDEYYVVANGVVYEYGADRIYRGEYGTDRFRFVAAAPDGTIYAASDRSIYTKKKGEIRFSDFLTLEQDVSGLNVGIGGKILYVLTGETLSAYSREGTLLGALTTAEGVKSFAVDYRGNVFLLSEEGKLLKYTRTLDGYAEPVRYDLATDYGTFTDVALDGDGRLYLVADHNVLIYPKTQFGAFVAEDSDFKDEVPAAEPRFVCEVVKDHTISYIAPDNFEDITSIPRGTRLMCYASITYAGDEYLRVETEKGTAYLPRSDVKVYEEGAAPFRKARCLLPALGTMVIGVDLYAEPSHLALAAGVQPLFAALGKEDVFDVISYVAVDDAGKDVWGFFRVNYQGKTAYVPSDEVVSVDDDPEPAPPRYEARVKSDALGKTVAVYAAPSTESEIVAKLTDGTEIYTLEPIDETKQFIQVLYDGEIRYVLSANLGQGGLSGGQTLAIVLSVVAVVGSVLTILILRANKRHKRYHKE